MYAVLCAKYFVHYRTLLSYMDHKKPVKLQKVQ